MRAGKALTNTNLSVANWARVTFPQTLARTRAAMPTTSKSHPCSTFTSTDLSSQATATFHANEAGRLDLPEGFISNLIGSSPALQEIRRLISKVAPTNARVLITGETGSGKEVVANDIYLNSTRRDKPFITVNCAAIPGSLIESVLFGCEDGAFTDANGGVGIFDAANGGTLFLDEVGELDQRLQSKLARVLEYGTFQRVGGTDVITVNVRIISATNRNLSEALARGEIERGLFDRLNTFPIPIQPLRERPEDIIPIAVHLLDKNRGFVRDKVVREIRPEVLDKLARYEWPGNVRQLENVIKRAIVLSRGGVINEDDIALTNSDAVIRVFEHFDDVALSNAPVLIIGEAGAGKENIARQIHAKSSRAQRPLIIVPCANLHGDLAESELFGHKKHAFTGASKDHRGFFEVANGATLLLDEIGALPLNVQAKILRAIQEGEITIMGTNTPVRVNVRIIATSNHDLEQDVLNGNFREDLLHRLSVIPMTIPSLRERVTEIPALAMIFLKELRGTKNITGISSEAMDKLQQYEWPGNIRQLKSIIERAIILADEGRALLPEDIVLDEVTALQTRPEITLPSNPFIVKHLNELLDYVQSNEKFNEFKLDYLFFKYHVARWVSESRNLLEKDVVNAYGASSATLSRLVNMFSQTSTRKFINAMLVESTQTIEPDSAQALTLPSDPVLLHHLSDFIDYANQDKRVSIDRMRFLLVKYRLAKALIEDEHLSEAKFGSKFGYDRRSIGVLLRKFDYGSTGELMNEIQREIVSCT